MKKANSLNHLAIIMDGNGRWAKERGKARVKGHEMGAKNVKTITEFVAKTEVKYLTLYAFSTENWQRPKSEVEALMKLLGQYLKSQKEEFLKNDIRFETIGDESAFSKPLREQIQSLKEATKNCKSLTQVLALNYGAKDELRRAAQKISKSGLEFDEKNIKNALDIGVDVDLLIRTGGDHRLSNFLLWQSAYAELFFSPTLWPDFSTEELEKIMQEYKTIERRFGKV